jgi:hypothetical protein
MFSGKTVELGVAFDAALEASDSHAQNFVLPREVFGVVLHDVSFQTS